MIKKKHQTNNRWKNQNDGELISENKTLVCKQCGNEQTFTNKYSYRRAMGIAGVGKNDKLENSGLCGKCRKSAKRKGWTLSPEIVEKMRETAVLNQTPYDSVEEWSRADRKKSNWYKSCDRISRLNLKKYLPDEYKRYMDNRWDGTNYDTGLTIEHIKPKSECYKSNELLECSDISNLKIVTMKENVELWEKYNAEK